MRLLSPVIPAGGSFPIDYTCNGKNVNPPLGIVDVPKAAKSLVLIFDDPDAAKEPAGRGQTFDHWVMFNLSPVDQDLPENSTPREAQFGKNSMGKSEYIGPCPPTFKHAYYFRLYALDSRLDLEGMPTKVQVLQAAQGHIIEEAELLSYYEQPNRE
jgi:Raf kinase inhibitor-like YbhB/YbcL family protein